MIKNTFRETAWGKSGIFLPGMGEKKREIWKLKEEGAYIGTGENWGGI